MYSKIDHRLDRQHRSLDAGRGKRIAKEWLCLPNFAIAAKIVFQKLAVADLWGRFLRHLQARWPQNRQNRRVHHGLARQSPRSRRKRFAELIAAIDSFPSHEPD
jgi:hypothetical protein